GVGGGVGGAGEGGSEGGVVVAFGALDGLGGRRARDAASLELGHDHPTDLVDLLVAPLLGPKADRADTGAALRVDDLEHTLVVLEFLVAALTLAEFLRRLGPAQLLGHA